jgi:hypothetical protein
MLGALALGTVVAGAAAPPAMADGWRGHGWDRGHREWRGHWYGPRIGFGFYPRATYYAPPPIYYPRRRVYYAPPPVYYGPQGYYPGAFNLTIR